MRGRFEQRRSRTAEWSRRIGAFSVALFLTSALSHRFGLIETPPFLWLLGLCLLLALIGFGLAVVAAVRIWRHGLLGAGSAALGLFFCAAILAPYGFSVYGFASQPPLADVSTDTSRPLGMPQAAALRVPPMNPLDATGAQAAALQADSYSGLTGRRYEYDKQNVVLAVTELLAERRWTVLSPMPTSDAGQSVTIEAVGYSYLLGFPSDVAIRIEDRSDATYVDMRSVSRYGGHDMGENAERIERFLDDLDERLQAPRES